MDIGMKKGHSKVANALFNYLKPQLCYSKQEGVK